MESNSKPTRKEAGSAFKKEERDREGTRARMEYEAEAEAVRERTARLRGLRLAKDAARKQAILTKEGRNSKPPRGRGKS